MLLGARTSFPLRWFGEEAKTMSMEVDLTTPLTPEERNNTHTRGREPGVERADNLHGVEGADVPTGDGTGPVTMQLGTAEQQAQRREQLLAGRARRGAR